MFYKLIQFFQNDIYVQISTENVKVTKLKTGQSFNYAPYLALEKDNAGKTMIKAVGLDAKSLMGMSGVEVCNPFLHPRSLIKDFTLGEKFLLHVFRDLHSNPLTISPRVIMHPMEKVDGGLTEIEIRAFKEMCLGAGAREAVLYVGQELALDKEKPFNKAFNQL